MISKQLLLTYLYLLLYILLSSGVILYNKLAEARKTRGPRVEDGTAQRDRPLYEVLKENKDRKDAEFNKRFKHRPPKALDEDETEFLEKLETDEIIARIEEKIAAWTFLPIENGEAMQILHYENGQKYEPHYDY